MKSHPSVIIIAISTIAILTYIQIDAGIKREKTYLQIRQGQVERHNQLMKELNELSRSQDIRIRQNDSIINSYNHKNQKK